MQKLSRLMVALVTIVASSATAQESCICLKCLFGQHRLVQAMSQSMAPALEPGDCRQARYINGEFERPQYGDIVYFQHPILEGQYVDRVLAMGGDTVQMIEGIVWLNGAPLTQVKMADYTVPYERTGPESGFPMCQNRPGIGGLCHAERFVETAPNGRSYQVLNISDARSDNTEEFFIPEGFVFVLGDHRDNSIDSRFSQTGPMRGVGFVPLENIIGIIQADASPSQ